MRYRCLILDHDDTATEGTRTVHYPAYVEVMRRLRPHSPVLTFEEWMIRNCDPGILDFFTKELGMNEVEMQREYEIWRSFSARIDPPFFEGILDLLRDFRERGGTVAVVSHSEAEIIERNYRAAGGGLFIPDAIYGWEVGPERRKPNPWPVLDVLARYEIEPERALVVDDLKPGVDMARAAGVAAGAAGWAYSVARIRSYMSEACDYYFESVASLRRHLFG